MTTDFRALCAELLAHAERAQSVAAQDLWFGDEDDGLFDRARTAMAEAAPESGKPTSVVGNPTDEELLTLLPQSVESGFWLPGGLPSDWVDGDFIAPPEAIVAFARDVLELWGCPAPASNPWKDTLLDALVCNFLLNAENEDNPKKALNDLIAWEKQLATDPLINPELHAAFNTYAVDECHHNLLERARAALTEPESGIPKNCWLDEDPGLCPSPCVFDDPNDHVCNCMFATKLETDSKPKTDCKYYRQ